ncbi:hypothetical protein MRX96_013501 [Rhipicephalus microplus]
MLLSLSCGKTAPALQSTGSASIVNFTWAHGAVHIPPLGAIVAAAPADMAVYNKVSVPQARSSAAKNGTVHAARAAVICDSSGRFLGTRRGCGVDENS